MAGRIALAALMLPLISSAHAGVHAQQVRDSAGVTIVRNPAVMRAPHTVVLTSPPLVSIGVLEGDESQQLHRVVGATRLNDGRIVVANAGSLELRFFDARGRHVKSVGKQGEGPGEFQSMTSLLRGPGDSLFVFDDRLRRITVFTPAGERAREFRLDAGDVARFPVPRGVLDNGTVVASAGRVYSTRDSETGATRDTMLVLRFSRAGQLQGVLERLPGSESYVLAREGSVSVSDMIFGRSASVAVGDARIFAAANDAYRVDAWDAGGDRVLSIRSDQPQPEVTERDVNEEKERRMPRRDGQNSPMIERMMRDQRAMLDAMPTPRTFPAWRSLLAGADGRLWVQSWTRHGQPAEWAVYDARGRLSLAVRARREARLMDAGGDWVLLHWRDDDEVEHVGVWRVQ